MPTTKTFCGPTTTLLAIIALTVLAIVVYANMVVDTGVVVADGVSHCMPLRRAYYTMLVLSNVDLVVNVIVPNIIITGLYTIIGVKVRSAVSSPIHSADADETKLFCRVASASAVCT